MPTHGHGCVLHVWFIWHLGKTELKDILRHGGEKKKKKKKLNGKKGGK